MKYSIEWDDEASACPVEIKAKFARTFTHFQSTTALQVTPDDRLRLKHVINDFGAEIEENKSAKNMEIEVPLLQETDWQQLKLAWAGEEQWILFFENPLRIVFVLKKYAKMVPISLAEPLPLVQLSCFVSYPEVILYGHKEAAFTNHIYSLNLATFETRELTAAKNYHPGNRKHYWACFSDNRLYVYGGVNKNGQPVEELFWTYNIENGNWFALDMPSNNLILNNNSLNCQIQSGKVLVLSEDKLLLVQLYQSRVNEVQGWNGVISQRQRGPFKGFFIYKGYVYFIYEDSLASFKIKIIKTKKQK